ncbi:MAG: hypothetical protein RMM53_08500, partial [Bacteroidia bacterium]|nr:hypothetical protein [Bacteroidia bacterium]
KLQKFFKKRSLRKRGDLRKTFPPFRKAFESLSIRRHASRVIWAVHRPVSLAWRCILAFA